VKNRHGFGGLFVFLPVVSYARIVDYNNLTALFCLASGPVSPGVKEIKSTSYINQN